MSLSAWEQQALDSIKTGLAGSDPALAALLSAFNRLASDEEMPDREKTRAGSRRAFRRRRRARWRFGLRRMFQRRVFQGLGFQRGALLALWLLTTAALIAVVLTLSAGGNRGTCAETAAMTCAGPAPGHSPGAPTDSTTTRQASEQQVPGIVSPPSW